MHLVNIMPAVIDGTVIFVFVLLIRLMFKLLQRKVHFISLTNQHCLYQCLEKLRYWHTLILVQVIFMEECGYCTMLC